MAVELREFAFLWFGNQIAHSSSNNTQLCFKFVWLLNDTFGIKFCFFSSEDGNVCVSSSNSAVIIAANVLKDQPSFALSKHGLIGCLGCQDLSDPFKGNQSHRATCWQRRWLRRQITLQNVGISDPCTVSIRTLWHYVLIKGSLPMLGPWARLLMFFIDKQRQ